MNQVDSRAHVQDTVRQVPAHAAGASATPKAVVKLIGLMGEANHQSPSAEQMPVSRGNVGI